MVLYEMCFVELLFFFFFKQKTAYEMRISDWSSDVCSSDLLGMTSATTFTSSAPRYPSRFPLEGETARFAARKARGAGGTARSSGTGHRQLCPNSDEPLILLGGRIRNR